MKILLLLYGITSAQIIRDGSHQRFNWRRVLLKENSNVYAWIVAAFLVDGIAHWRAGDFLESAGGRLFIVILIVATAAFAAIRVLKKTGRLKEASSATP